MDKKDRRIGITVYTDRKIIDGIVKCLPAVKYRCESGTRTVDIKCSVVIFVGSDFGDTILDSYIHGNTGIKRDLHRHKIR